MTAASASQPGRPRWGWEDEVWEAWWGAEEAGRRAREGGAEAEEEEPRAREGGAEGQRGGAEGQRGRAAAVEAGPRSREGGEEGRGGGTEGHDCRERAVVSGQGRAGWRAGAGGVPRDGEEGQEPEAPPLFGRGLKGEKRCFAPHQLGLQRPSPPADTVWEQRGAALWEALRSVGRSMAEVTIPPVTP